MTGRDVLAMQLAGSFNMLRERLDMLSEQEWTARAIPGTNLPGFTLWHALRTIDWGVHCAIQGVPEVADRPEWRNLHASEFVYGAGITSQEADQVAHLVSRDQVRDYLGAVQPAALDWLKQQSDGDLDRKVDLSAGGFGTQKLGWMLNLLLLNRVGTETGEIAVLKGIEGAKGYPLCTNGV